MISKRLGISVFILFSLSISILRYQASPFPVEDAIVYFHRANYTDLAPVHYYAGYISLPAQLYAWSLSSLPPFLQSALYVACPAVLWLALGLYLMRLPNGISAVLILLAYCAVFFDYLFYSLTYSLWTSVTLIGAILYLRTLQGRPLNYIDTVTALLVSFASPLSIFFTPAALYLWRRDKKDIGAALIAIAGILSAILLPDHNDPHSNLPGLISQLWDIALYGLADPLGFTGIKGAWIHHQIERALEWLAVLIVLAGLLHSLLARNLQHRAGRALCLIAPIAILAVSFATQTRSDMPLTVRYFFPVLTFAAILIGQASQTRLATFSRAAALMAVTAAMIAVLPGLYRSSAQIVTQAEGSPIVLHRDGRGGANQWTAVIGDFHAAQSECRPHETLPEDLLFQIHCDRDLRIVVRR